MVESIERYKRIDSGSTQSDDEWRRAVCEGRLRTVADFSRHHARQRGSHVASWFAGNAARWFDGRITTYGELDRRSNRIGQALLADGVGRGDRVAYVGMNSDRYFELLFGCAKIGAVVVPVDWKMAPSEVASILEESGAGLIFADEAGLDCVKSAVPHLSSLLGVVAVESPAHGWPGFSQWCGAYSSDDPEIAVGPDDPIVQIYTSGASVRPGAVVLSHKNLVYGFLQPESHRGHPWAQWVDRDVVVSAMPVFDVNGLVGGLQAYFAGAFSVILRQFDRSEVPQFLTRFSVTRLLLFTEDLQSLLCLPKIRRAGFLQLQYIFYFGAPIPIGLLQEAIKIFGCGFCRLYGLAETAGPIACLLPEDHHQNNAPLIHSVGSPLAHTSLRVRKSDGTLAAPSEAGYIEIRSAQNMIGYWMRPEMTEEVLSNDGWLKTGDVGYLADDGYLFVLGRVEDVDKGAVLKGVLPRSDMRPGEGNKKARFSPTTADPDLRSS